MRAVNLEDFFILAPPTRIKIILIKKSLKMKGVKGERKKFNLHNAQFMSACE
jgi:hypothetical protein